MVASSYSHRYRRGWFGDSYRHYLARKGISTVQKRYFYKGNRDRDVVVSPEGEQYGIKSLYASGIKKQDLLERGFSGVPVHEKPSIYERVMKSPSAQYSALSSAGPIPLVAGPPVRVELPAPEMMGALPAPETQEVLPAPELPMMLKMRKKRLAPIATPGTPGASTGPVFFEEIT